MTRHDIIARMQVVVRDAQARIDLLDAGDYSTFRYCKDSITACHVKHSYEEMIATAHKVIDKAKLPEDFV